MPNDAPGPAKPKLGRGAQALVGFGAVDAGGSVLAYATGVWAQVAPWVAAVTTGVGIIVGVVRFWPFLSKFVKTVDVIGGLPAKLEEIQQTSARKTERLNRIDEKLDAIQKDDRIDQLTEEVRAVARRQEAHEQDVAQESAFWKDAKPVVKKLLARAELGLPLVATGPVVVVQPTVTERSAG